MCPQAPGIGPKPASASQRRKEKPASKSATYQWASSCGWDCKGCALPAELSARECPGAGTIVAPCDECGTRRTLGAGIFHMQFPSTADGLGKAATSQEPRRRCRRHVQCNS